MIIGWTSVSHRVSLKLDSTIRLSMALIVSRVNWVNPGPSGREGQDPETVHHEESPNCEFITGQSDNVSIAEQMRYEQNRLDSFPSWLFNHWFEVSVAQRLAKAGFYHWGLGDIKCFSCGLYKPMTFWLEGHDPETVHRRESPDCKFINGKSDNVPKDTHTHQKNINWMHQSPFITRCERQNPKSNENRHWSK